MGTRMLLKHYLERGVSKAELSSRFGISRRTIHAWIEAGELDRDLAAGATRYSPRPRRPHKLDPYKGIIDARPPGRKRCPTRAAPKQPASSHRGPPPESA